MMWWWGNNGMGALGWVGFAFLVIFWVSVVVGVVYLVRYLGARTSDDRWHEPPERDEHRTRNGDTEDPGRRLEERYARGEIDREEFLQRRADLEHRASQVTDLAPKSGG